MKENEKNDYKKKIILTEQQLKYCLFEISNREINDRCKLVNQNPTQKQIEANNYRLAHFSIKGMPISIENPKGSFRYYKNEDGSEGKSEMKSHYGYFKKTSGNGKDGDAVDCFIGPNPENFTTVYVVDQNSKDGSFDESKVMLGFDSITDAKKGYMENYSKDWTGFREITGVDINTFKKWLYRKRKQRKPFSDYIMIRKNKINKK